MNRGICLLAVFCLLGPLPAGGGEILPETMARIAVNEPPAEEGWEPATADLFPWSPRVFVTGWSKESTRGHSGIFWAFQRPSYKVPAETLSDNLGQSLAEVYDATAVSEPDSIVVDGYGGVSMTFAGEGGSGLFFGEGQVPTTARFVYVQLEEQSDTGVWPLALFFCAAPTELFDPIARDFESVVASVRIAAPGMRAVPPLDAGSAETVHRAAIAVPRTVHRGDRDPVKEPGSFAASAKTNGLMPPNRLPGMSFEEYRDSQRTLRPALLIPPTSFAWCASSLCT